MALAGNMITRRFLRLILATGGLSIAVGQAQAQATGVKFTMDYLHPVLTEGRQQATIGIGVDHDMSDRIGFGLDVRYGGTSGYSTEAGLLEVLYSAKYFTSSNDDRTAFYLGSFIGYQRIKGTFVRSIPGTGPNYFSTTNTSEEYTNTQIPIGLRLGVRGGLQGFFGEVYAHIGYAIGSGAVLPELNTTPLFMSVGVGLGGGW
jgi:hypothetical protein